jgi:hypothetical protein
MNLAVLSSSFITTSISGMRSAMAFRVAYM